jgi:hypothetical protein
MSRKSKRQRQIARREERADASRTLSWRVFPFLEDWRKSALAVALIIGLTVATYYFSPTEPFYIGAPPFMFLVLHGYFLPTTYILSKDFIEIRRFLRPQKVDWGRFRSFNYDNQCVVFSPYEGPTGHAVLRTMCLMFDKSLREEILDYLRQRLIDVKSQSTATDRTADGPETDA